MTLGEFRPGVSCRHGWLEFYDFDGELCADCGATCRRDERGRIIEYSAMHEVLNQARAS